jgi:putative transposase
VAEAIGYLKGKKLYLDCAEPGTQATEFLGYKFWARGYFVSTVGRDGETIRAYIRSRT